MQDLSVCFHQHGNVTLLRHDSYLGQLKPGVKFDTVAALRTSLHVTSLFPNCLIAKAEDEISHHNDRRYPYHLSGKQAPEDGKKAATPAWKQLSSKEQSKCG